MRKIRNVTNEELTALKALCQWDEHIAKTLQPDTKLLWIHNRRKKYTSLQQDDTRLIRTVKIKKIDAYEITTDFGRYALESGRNVHDACGCKRFCDCYGRLYLFSHS